MLKPHGRNDAVTPLLARSSNNGNISDIVASNPLLNRSFLHGMSTSGRWFTDSAGDWRAPRRALGGRSITNWRARGPRNPRGKSSWGNMMLARVEWPLQS
eukprot:7657414-Pyramimonas_sp.AAC.1